MHQRWIAPNPNRGNHGGSHWNNPWHRNEAQMSTCVPDYWRCEHLNWNTISYTNNSIYKSPISMQYLVIFNRNPKDFCVDSWPCTKFDSTTTHESVTTKAVLSAGKVMATVFRDFQGIIIINYLEKYNNRSLLCSIIGWFKKRIKGKTTKIVKLHELVSELVPHPLYLIAQYS